ncbi:MAG: aminotransferase class V-fold PLP-dependent enzyme [Planctomycetota bacterium]
MEDLKAKFEKERQRFPITKRFAYLNHASRGPLSPPAYDFILKRAKEMCVLHPGQLREMNQDFRSARQGIADLIGASRNSIGFIPNTSAGLAMAAGSLPIENGDNVICSDAEFPANVFPWLNLKHRGVEVRMLERGPAGITPDQVREAMDERTRAVAISWIGFADGIRIDTSDIAGLCASSGAWFVLDAIQGVGAVQVDLEGIDVLVCGSGKWTLAPQGGGFVYVRRDRIERLKPDRVGWLSMAQNADLDDLTRLTDYRFELADDARRIETGSNSPLTQMALGESCRYLHGLGLPAIEQRIFGLCDHLMEGLRSKGIEPLPLPGPDLRSGIVCFPVPEPETFVQRLFAEGVQVSTREGMIRVGIHFYNNEDDLDRLLKIVQKT